ncbi:acyl carrier protein [Streptomyces sp. H27-C3]|uniref:acyl carrier protein n=1 Tax=Streptomyces sp. H27-C3 TaxID=3046305 RepID=UPI0024B96B42|nr:acyl carrier protein [Streptomyces sp. H27-C3]MDJ0466252.1 acyl carrier protein [Streptomyces sp. H27-C3]
MSVQEFTLADLKRILREAAGADETVGVDEDIIDATFEALGYESLALLETGSRIEREYSVSLNDDVLAVEHTPRTLIEAVNASRTSAAAA